MYIFWFLHQTTTIVLSSTFDNCCISFDSYIKPQRTEVGIETNDGCISFDSYIKPQHTQNRGRAEPSCISFDSYIKPQPFSTWCAPSGVVYLLIPTSNHNKYSNTSQSWLVVYLLIPTSNHNSLSLQQDWEGVVYLLIPTSNHNLQIWTYWFSAHNKHSI